MEEMNDPNCINGEGNIISMTRDIQTFNTIEKSSIIDLTVRRSETESLIIRTQENVQESVITNFNDNRLEIKLESGCYNNTDIEVILETAIFEQLIVSGTGDVNVEGFDNLAELTIDKSSTGELRLVGSTEVLNLTMSGTGDVKAFSFITDRCLLTKTGTGTLEITVNTSIDGTMSGTGDLRYKGDPTISLDKPGTGEIIDAN